MVETLSPEEKEHLFNEIDSGSVDVYTQIYKALKKVFYKAFNLDPIQRKENNETGFISYSDSLPLISDETYYQILCDLVLEKEAVGG